MPLVDLVRHPLMQPSVTRQAQTSQWPDCQLRPAVLEAGPRRRASAVRLTAVGQLLLAAGALAAEAVAAEVVAGVPVAAGAGEAGAPVRGEAQQLPADNGGAAPRGLQSLMMAGTRTNQQAAVKRPRMMPVLRWRAQEHP